MKFYGNGAVWDAGCNRQLCKFINGELETEDEHIKSTLIRLGYPYEPEDPKINEIKTEDQQDLPSYEPTRKELIADAKIHGIVGADRMSKDKLIEVLKGEI